MRKFPIIKVSPYYFYRIIFRYDETNLITASDKLIILVSERETTHRALTRILRQLLLNRTNKVTNS